MIGASKVAADVMCQEYGRYFGMNVGIFRGGCLTGPNHSGVELHGFLAYLIKCVVQNKPYKVFGYKGKQVRDNIDSHDLIDMFWHFHQSPRQGEVYNAGGGRQNSISVLEAITHTNQIADTSYTNYSILPKNKCILRNVVFFSKICRVSFGIFNNRRDYFKFTFITPQTIV